MSRKPQSGKGAKGIDKGKSVSKKRTRGQPAEVSDATVSEDSGERRSKSWSGRGVNQQIPTLHPLAIRAVRKAQGKSQAQFAEDLGYDPQSTKHWENASRGVEHPGLLSLAIRALTKKLPPKQFSIIRVDELRKSKVESLEARATSKRGRRTSSRGVAKPVSERSAANAIPGVDMQTGEVLANDATTVDADELTRWAWSQGLTLKDLADRFRCNATTVRRWSSKERMPAEATRLGLACAAIEKGFQGYFREAEFISYSELERLREDLKSKFAERGRQSRLNAKDEQVERRTAVLRKRNEQRRFRELLAFAKDSIPSEKRPAKWPSAPSDIAELEALLNGAGISQRPVFVPTTLDDVPDGEWVSKTDVAEILDSEIKRLGFDRIYAYSPGGINLRRDSREPLLPDPDEGFDENMPPPSPEGYTTLELWRMRYEEELNIDRMRAVGANSFEEMHRILDEQDRAAFEAKVRSEEEIEAEAREKMGAITSKAAALLESGNVPPDLAELLKLVTSLPEDALEAGFYLAKLDENQKAKAALAAAQKAQEPPAEEVDMSNVIGPEVLPDKPRRAGRPPRAVQQQTDDGKVVYIKRG